MNTERTEKFVNAIACDLEEGGFRQVSGTMLRRTLSTAVSAALPLLQSKAGTPSALPSTPQWRTEMSDTKISEAAVEAALIGWSTSKGQGARELMRSALEGAASYLHRESAPVATVGSMPGTDGFTMACFTADEVPVGTPLYLNPQPAELAEQKGGSRAQFEAWMTDTAKIIVGSGDPYPAGLERDYWRVWQAALAATGKQPAGEVPTFDTGLENWLRDRDLMPDYHNGLVEMEEVIEALNEHERMLMLPAQVGEVQGDALRDRTPADYATEHAGYLVTAANQVLEARNELDALVLRREEDDDVDEDEMQAAQECVGDANSVLRIAIHEFEKRRDRALAARQPGAQEPRAWLIHWSHIPLEAPEVTTSASRVDAVNALTDPPRIEPLYGAAPAQGIDLGQLREKLTKLTRRNEFISGQSFSYVQLDDVLALIDQRDAAPGVGS